MNQQQLKVPQWLTWLAAICVAGIAFGSFALSFSALSDLAARSGIPVGIAWVWPTIIDGSIVTAMLVIFAWRDAGRREVTLPWVTLGFFALVSVIGNAVHTVAVVDDTNGVAIPFAVFVGSMPPIAFLLSSEMLVRIMAGRQRSVEVAHAVTESIPEPEPTVKDGEPSAPASGTLARRGLGVTRLSCQGPRLSCQRAKRENARKYPPVRTIL